MTTTKWLACAITYEPTSEQIERVCAQLTLLGGKTVVHDNSVTADSRERVHATCAANGVEVVSAEGNVGSAGGLNNLLSHAAERGLMWLVYFDQDSRLGEGYGECLSRLDECPADVAMVGSRYRHPREGFPAGPDPTSAMLETRFVIASGTAMRTSALLEVDGFDRRMFLDVVDHEICMRLRRAGWKLLVDTARVMMHEIGEDSTIVLRRVRISRHPLWRRYQMWRNSITLMRRYVWSYPGECLSHLAVRLVETLGGAVHYREPRYITTAVRGAGAGLFGSSRRQGYSAPDVPGRAGLSGA